MARRVIQSVWNGRTKGWKGDKKGATAVRKRLAPIKSGLWGVTDNRMEERNKGGL